MRRPTNLDNAFGGPNINDDSSRSNESTSVRSDFNCLYDQSFHADDDSIALTDSNDTAVESNENANGNDDERTSEAYDPDSGSELDEAATQESVEDYETELLKSPLGRGQVIIHTAPVYSEFAHSSDKQASPEVNRIDLSDVEVTSLEELEHPTPGHDSVVKVDSKPQTRRGVFGIASLFSKTSRARSSRPLEEEAVKEIPHAYSLPRETSSVLEPEPANRDVNIIIATDGNSLHPEEKRMNEVNVNSEGSETRPVSDRDCKPGKLLEEESKPKLRLGLFRNRTRSIKSTDDDAATVSSKKSFGSRLSEGSRKSLSSLRSRISFRRREKADHRDDLDDESVDSTSIVVSFRGSLARRPSSERRI
jgi:hypothetical protein